MKAISIKNPFASLIANGIKTTEVRSWNTDYRGDILICSTQLSVKDLSKYLRVGSNLGLDTMCIINEMHNVPNGCVVAVAELYDVVPYGVFENGKQSFREDAIALLESQDLSSCTSLGAIREYQGEKPYYLFMLRNIKTINPIPIKGQLGIFNLEMPQAIKCLNSLKKL